MTIEKTNIKHLALKKEGTLWRFEIKNIIYIERVKNKKGILVVSFNEMIWKKDETEFHDVTLKYISEIFSHKKELLRCHKSIIINPLYIEKLNLNKKFVKLRHIDDIIPIGDSYKKDFEKLYKLCMFIVIHILYTKRFYQTFIILILENAINVVIQMISILIVTPFPIHELIKYSISAILSVCIAVFLFNKVPINKILRSIEYDVLVRSGFYLLNVIFFVCILSFSFEYGTITLYQLLFILLIFLSMFGFIITVTKIFYYTNQLPCISHDMENALIGMYISVDSTNDVQEIKNDINAYFKTLGMNVPKRAMGTDINNCRLLTFIQHKKFERMDLKKIVLETNIQYNEPYSQVPDATLIIILAILLDNAMDATPSGKKIKILVYVTEELLVLEVSNAHTKKSINDLTQIFKKGYSTKESKNRKHGYGLSNLQRIVQEHKGCIFAENLYDKEEKSMYLCIRAVFRNDYSD